MDNSQAVYNYLSSKSTFTQKPEDLKRRISEALYILFRLGIPIEGTPRQLERIGMAFMAVTDVTALNGWDQAKDLESGRSMKTRDIITYVNTNFGENMSSGSYDDIRRQALNLPIVAEIIIGTSPGSARNSPTRGYALNPVFASVVRSYGRTDWDRQVHEFLSNKITLAERLASRRELPSTPVRLPSGGSLHLGPGKHNELQRAIIEQFLPTFGYKAEVLYVGDAEHRAIVYQREQLQKLGFFELEHGVLPDIVAYSMEKKWLYIIEAVASVGPIHKLRKLKLEELTADCTAPIVYVTAFLTSEDFARNAANIAWETEVWIATNPEHMIHYNGPKFMGPYNGEIPTE